MPHAPLQFNTIACKHCGAIVALMPPGCILYTTRLRCPHCLAIRTIQAYDSSEPKKSTLAPS